MSSEYAAETMTAASDRIAASARSPARGLMLAMLVLIYTLNYVDRQIVVILQEPIRAEFHLKDWQLGLLTGASISLLYTVMGIPIARWVDRGVHRVALIASITAAWSLMTALCGVSRSYIQFVTARMGVGMAEAGFAPTSHSLLSDLYPQRRRPFAMGIFALGIPLGVMVGLAGGGIIAQRYDWRTALLMVSLPGLIVALGFALVAREPVRGAAEADRHAPVGPLDFGAALRALWRSPAYVQLLLASASASFAMAGLSSWLPSFLIRVHGMTLAQAGFSLGLLIGLAGLAGTLGGGWQATRLGGRGMHAMVWVPMIGLAVAVPLFVAALLVPTPRLAIALLAPPMMLGYLWAAPSIALSQSLAPVAARATASAICIVTSNVIGVAFGPIVAGLLSDAFARVTGDTATGLRWALVCTAFAALWSVVHWLLVARALRRNDGIVPAEPMRGDLP